MSKAVIIYMTKKLKRFLKRIVLTRKTEQEIYLTIDIRETHTHTKSKLKSVGLHRSIDHNNSIRSSGEKKYFSNLILGFRHQTF